LICKCGAEASLEKEHPIQVPADLDGCILRVWACPECNARFHTIEGRLETATGMRVVNEFEAAAILGKSVHTLRNERAGNRSPVPWVKQGRRIGYLLSDLAEHLMACRVGGKGA